MLMVQGFTAVLLAAIEGHTEVAQILVDADADLDTKDAYVSACWECRC